MALREYVVKHVDGATIQGFRGTVWKDGENVNGKSIQVELGKGRSFTLDENDPFFRKCKPGDEIDFVYGDMKEKENNSQSGQQFEKWVTYLYVDIVAVRPGKTNAVLEALPDLADKPNVAWREQQSTNSNATSTATAPKAPARV